MFAYKKIENKETENRKIVKKKTGKLKIVRSLHPCLSRCNGNSEAYREKQKNSAFPSWSLGKSNE
jgi:hypothetical protein